MYYADMISTSSSNFERLLCVYCRTIYTNPHSLDCGHIFCLSPCILSFQTDGASIHCSSCGFASPIDGIKVEEKIGKEVRDFKLKNEYVEISSCPTCQRPNCNVCELCKHCDRYLCHECATSHQTMYSSVLFSRLLDLQLRYKNYVARRGEMKWENANDAIERLQETIEGALLRAEICLESLEILLNDLSPKMSTKLTEITGLFALSERNGGLSKRLSNTASEIRNGYPRTSHNLPLNVQNFVNKFQKDFRVSKNDVASSSESSLTSSLSRGLTPTQSLDLCGQSDVALLTSELSTNELVAAANESEQSASKGILYFQAHVKQSKVALPTMDEIEEYFRQFGKVAEVILCSDPPSGYVIFGDKNSAKNSLAVIGHSVMGCKITINEASKISLILKDKIMYYADMISTSSSNFERLLCVYCRTIYTNPHSLDCGHVFCLSPCILSFQTDGASIHCSSCGFASPIDDIKVEEKIGKEVRDFKLKNEYVEISSCPNCQRLNCNVCELCKHCDRYLCHECAASHKTMYSSVLFSRLLDLQLRYKNYVDRRGEMKGENANDAIERLQETIEGALLRAEICLESLEILLNDQSPKMSTKLTEITGLFTLSERNGGLSKRLSNTASEIRNGYSRTSYNVPLNVENFVNKYQKDFRVSKNDVASSSESSLTSSLSRGLTPTQSLDLCGQYDVTLLTSELATNEV
ncbi:unnamed protein product [Rodentolepis nana]|uniref:RRM domain-containing protein n=1 Tax=Rodentolepis nana TaxID=102285 RepID=A0A0R3TKD8_RODNA|nr:unnamed protein product [Rodentolepis nana]